MPRVAAKKQEKQLPVLSQREIEDLKAKVRMDKGFLAGAEGHGPDGDESEARLPVREAGVDVDTGAAQARISRTQKAIALLDPKQRVLTGAERQRGEKRYAELSAILPERMLTNQEMNFFPAKVGDADQNAKDQAYQKAVEKACMRGGEHSTEFIRMAQEWKTLGRLLWPDDPEKSNLEFIRPNGSGSGRHFSR